MMKPHSWQVLLVVVPLVVHWQVLLVVVPLLVVHWQVLLVVVPLVVHWHVRAAGGGPTGGSLARAAAGTPSTSTKHPSA